MRKKEIVSKVKGLGLSGDEVLIYGSGAMVLRGVKEEASDVDLIAKGNDWERCKKMGKLVECDSGVGERVVFGNGVEVFNLSPWEEIKNVFAESEVIEGVRVASLESVKKYKKDRMSDKDKKDLELIEQFEKERLGR